MSNELKLLPCPFCGALGLEIREQDNGFYYGYMAHSGYCPMPTDTESFLEPEIFRNAWNTRASIEDK